MLLLTAAPIPKTIEDLGQEVTEDVLLARLEQQRALQEAAIRTYKADCIVVGQPKPAPSSSEGTDDDDDLDSAEDASFEEEEEEDEYEEDASQ